MPPTVGSGPRGQCRTIVVAVNGIPAIALAPAVYTKGIVSQVLLVSVDNLRELAGRKIQMLDQAKLETPLKDNGPEVSIVVGLTNAGNDLPEICMSEGYRLQIPLVEAIVPQAQMEDIWLLLTQPTISLKL